MNFIHPNFANPEQAFSKTDAFQFVQEKMQLRLVNASFQATANATGNPYCQPQKPPHKLDYCFFRLPDSWRIMQQSSELLFAEKAALSDHLAVLVELQISKMENC